MISNNELITYKNIWLSFINKWLISISFVILLIIIIPCSYLMITYWSEMPILIKIFGPIIFLITLLGIIVTPLNGMIITKKGNILFLPDFRLKKFKVKDIERISILFNEWENNKYSVSVKIIKKDGKIFYKDYSKQFRNMKNKKQTMSMYTITKRKVDKICNKLLYLNICVVTIIDNNRNIIYQSKKLH